MKILNICFAFNERKMLEYKLKWIRQEKIDFYVINNESNDGTEEFLIKNKIPYHNFSTNGEFHLKKLHYELIRTAKILNPDWLIYLSIDEFLITQRGIRKEIEYASANSFNSISSRIFEVCNTGEVIKNSIFETYLHYSEVPSQIRVCKYYENLNISGDNLVTTETLNSNSNFLLNYGMTKSKEERSKTLERRRKAWNSGLKRGFGFHYEIANKMNWIWDKNKLKKLNDIDNNFILDRLKTYLYLH
jgi:hypothetical protein